MRTVSLVLAMVAALLLAFLAIAARAADPPAAASIHYGKGELTAR